MSPLAWEILVALAARSQHRALGVNRLVVIDRSSAAPKRDTRSRTDDDRAPAASTRGSLGDVAPAQPVTSAPAACHLFSPPRRVLSMTRYAGRPEGSVPNFAKDVVIVGGCGHVGLPLGLALADAGCSVVLLRPGRRARSTGSGPAKMPFFENGADELLERVLGTRPARGERRPRRRGRGRARRASSSARRSTST